MRLQIKLTIIQLLSVVLVYCSLPPASATVRLNEPNKPVISIIEPVISVSGRGPVQYQKQTDLGTYKFGYDTGEQGAHSFRQEHRGFDGVVHGRYGYTDADGKLRYVEYSAGPFGYKVKGDTGAEPSSAKIQEGYKVPSDKDLTDVQAGLAKIKQAQLFGVPVTPYIKGYTHTENKEHPIQENKEVVRVIPSVSLHPVPAPPAQVVLVREQLPSHPVKSVFVEHPIENKVKGYVPPIAVQVPVKSYVPPTSAPRPALPVFVAQIPKTQNVIRIEPPRPQPVILFQKQEPIQQTSYVKGFTVITPPPQQVKVVYHPLPQVFEKHVTRPYLVKGTSQTQLPLIRVHPVVSPRPHHIIFQKQPVEDHYTKGYSAPPTPAPVQVVRVVSPAKGYVSLVPPKHVQVVYQKNHYVTTQTPKIVYVKSQEKVSPPIRQSVKVFERPVEPHSSKGYVISPDHPKSVCPKCRGRNSAAGYFPHSSLSRQYIFSRPVQPYVKGYLSRSQINSYHDNKERENNSFYRRVSPPQAVRGKSFSNHNDNDGLVWIPAPQQRYRVETKSYEEPPAHAYAPY